MSDNAYTTENDFHHGDGGVIPGLSILRLVRIILAHPSTICLDTKYTWGLRDTKYELSVMGMDLTITVADRDRHHFFFISRIDGAGWRIGGSVTARYHWDDKTQFLFEDWFEDYGFYKKSEGSDRFEQDLAILLLLGEVG